MSGSNAVDFLRRALVLGAPAAAVLGGCIKRSTPTALTVYKTPSCGCCKGWVTHMTRAGFIPTVVEMDDLNPIRDKLGVPFAISSCHTGVVGGYVVEGHVPPADVVRLLKEKPKAIGITVPGMPFGSPGMEQAGAPPEAFDTLLLLDRAGRTQVFAHHRADQPEA